eukprot:12907775-Heterocapsa_arctica.AAC.1
MPWKLLYVLGMWIWRGTWLVKDSGTWLYLISRGGTSIPHDRRDACIFLHNRIQQMREQSLRDKSFRACAHLAAPITGTCSGLCTLRLVM